LPVSSLCTNNNARTVLYATISLAELNHSNCATCAYSLSGLALSIVRLAATVNGSQVKNAGKSRSEVDL